MKHHQVKNLGILALLSASLGTNVFAQDTNTAAQIEGLKAQIGQLVQQVNDLSTRQQEADRKQTVSAVAEPNKASSDRGLRARYEGADVRVFGSFDVYYESQDTGNGQVDRLVSSGSGYTQLGFDAVKDIGQGTSVFGDVRLSFQPDNGKTNSTVRTFNTGWVGLTNNRLGTLQLGRQGTQMGEVLSTFRLIRLGTGNFIYSPASTLTHDNVVKYISPKFGNFQVSGNIDLGETVGNQRTGRGAAVLLKYDDGKTTALGGIFQSNAPLDMAATATDDRVEVASFGIGHNFGFMKPFFVAQNVRSDKSQNQIDLRGLYYGIDFPVGPGTLRLEGESITNNTLTNANATSMNIRYDWQLAANTMIYFTATKIQNDANVYYPIVGTGGFAAVPVSNTGVTQNNQTFNTSMNGMSPSSFAVGIKFDF
jgi:predicted porin